MSKPGSETAPRAGLMFCVQCDGRGWMGACSGGQFAYIGRLATAGRLPTRDCSACAGTGWRKPEMEEDLDD